jgi:uncharacterized protein (DUF305 family)
MLHSFTRRTALAAVIGLAALTGPGTGAAAATPRAAVAAAKANRTDRAFVREMVPHHQMAVDMAEMARMDGEHAKIRRLARRVIDAQTGEIRTLEKIARRLGVTPEAMPTDGEMSDQMMRDMETLGVDMDESGMTMDMHDLHGAKPFDRLFIDMMIAHHRGAIRMARAERTDGRDARLRRIARAIIADQAKEIRQMNAWRKAWYGRTSPSGGVPKG